MKRVLIPILMLALTAFAEEPPPTNATKSATDAMLDFYVDAAKTVDEHKRIAELTGRWKVTTSMWFDPSGAPKVSTGSGTGRAILGGRFIALDLDVRGDLPSQSLTIIGFDRRTSDYTLVGFDDLGTYYITAAGKYDDAKKAVHFDGTYAQPPTGQQQAYRFVWTRPGANEHLLTLYFNMAGKDVKVAETRLTRS